MAVKSRAGSGITYISIADEEFELVANASSMLEISRIIGGFSNAFDALRSVDVALLLEILKIGIGRKKAPKNLDDLVFENGIGPLLEPISVYLLMLQNGGKSPDDEEEVAQKPKGKAAAESAL